MSELKPMLKCGRCNSTKPRTDFPMRGRKRNGEQRYGYCRPCHGAYQREQKYRRLFNISVDEYEAMLAEQGGVCAICERAPKKNRLAVDHEHKTGLIRGLLCSACNRAIAGFAEDVERFRAAATYLEKPPARWVIGERYGRKGRTTNKAKRRKVARSRAKSTQNAK